MRKLVSIVLLLVYALSSSGISLYVHYCCGLPHGLAINDHPESHDPCSLCTESNHHGDASCEDEVCELGVIHHGCQDVRLDTVDATTEHITYADKSATSIAQPVEIALLWNVDMNPFVVDGLVFAFADSSPPLTSSVPIFIFNCTYRI